MPWPPTIEELREELQMDPGDTTDAAAHERYLAAGIGYVQNVRADAFETDDDGLIIDPPTLTAKAENREGSTLPLGALRVAARWSARRQSLDGVLFTADGRAGNLPPVDPDIQRLIFTRVVFG